MKQIAAPAKPMHRGPRRTGGRRCSPRIRPSRNVPPVSPLLSARKVCGVSRWPRARPPRSACAARRGLAVPGRRVRDAGEPLRRPGRSGASRRSSRARGRAAARCRRSVRARLSETAVCFWRDGQRVEHEVCGDGRRRRRRGGGGAPGAPQYRKLTILRRITVPMPISTRPMIDHDVACARRRRAARCTSS